MSNSIDTGQTLTEVILDRPWEFFVSGQRYCLWRPSLGLSLILPYHIGSLDLDEALLAQNPFLEALRVVSAKREESCCLLALHSFRSKAELCDTRLIKDRAKLYSEQLDSKEIATLLIWLLTQPGLKAVISMAGLDKESQEQAKVAKHKNKDGHTRSYGGRTLLGALIIPACEALNCNEEEAVWGMSYLKLRLAMADKVNTVYLTDDEIKSLHISTEGRLDANDINNMAAIKAANWD